jgi:uridine phosphorylase
MNRRRFEHANNPAFACADAVLLLPFGRTSYLPTIVDALGGESVELDATTDREVFRLLRTPSEVTLVYSGMGSPAAANALEMIAAAGGKRVVVFGACGGAAETVAIGDLVIASGAVRGEGTSAYYAPPGFPAVFDPLVTARLWEAASTVGAGFHRGVVYTTDAGYRQGPEIYEKCQGLVIGVESECAAVAVVSASLELRAGALLFCTDNVTLPRDQEHGYRGLEDPRVQRGFEAGLDVALSVLCTAPA